MRWQDLKDLFRRAGTVLRADVSLGPDNRSRGYGTVLLATAEDATPTRLVVTLVAVSAVAAAVSLWLTLRADQAAVSAGQGPAENAGSRPLPNWDATPDATG